MKKDLRTQIIEIATNLFMKQGYNATSTRQIASILNVSQPAIYHHFNNKEELFTEVIAKFAIEIGNNLNSILEKKQSKRDCLLEMSIYLREKHEMNFSLMMNDLENSISPETNKDIFYLWSENYFKPFIKFFESIECLILPVMSTETVSQHFLRVLSSYISKSPSNEEINTVKIKDIINIFLRGVVGNSFEKLTLIK